MSRSSVRAGQRLSALDRANEIRLRRAELHRDVGDRPTPRESAARAVEVLVEREEAVRTLAVGDFLLWPQRWGRTRMRKTITRTQIGERKPLGVLTERQVRLLVTELERPLARELRAT